MTHLERALLDERTHRLGQLQQAQQIADRRAGASDRLRRLLVRHLKLIDEARQSARFLQRIQVLALNVLDERNGDCRLIGNLADNGWDLGKARQLRRTPTPLTGNDLVAPRRAIRRLQRSYDDRLDDALRANRIRKLLQSLRAHIRAGLVAPTLQEVERKLGQFLARAHPVGRGGRHAARGGWAQQIRESPPECGSLVHHRRLIIANWPPVQARLLPPRDGSSRRQARGRRARRANPYRERARARRMRALRPGEYCAG